MTKLETLKLKLQNFEWFVIHGITEKDRMLSRKRAEVIRKEIEKLENKNNE